MSYAIATTDAEGLPCLVSYRSRSAALLHEDEGMFIMALPSRCPPSHAREEEEEEDSSHWYYHHLPRPSSRLKPGLCHHVGTLPQPKYGGCCSS